MNEQELTTLIRSVITELDPVGPNEAPAIVERLRKAGIQPGCHVGKGEEMQDNKMMQLEWYAGQILDITDSEAWFAMNSIINMVDTFAPEM